VAKVRIYPKLQKNVALFLCFTYYTNIYWRYNLNVRWFFAFLFSAFFEKKLHFYLEVMKNVVFLHDENSKII
jgi:hypothetical protein